MKKIIKNKKVVWIIAAVIIVLVLLIIMLRHGGSQGIERPVVKDVETAVIHSADVNDYYETSGTVKAKTVSTVASRIIGVVTAVKVREGDTVKAGQELLTIEKKGLLEKLRAAKAAFDEAQKALDAAKSNKALADTTYKRYKKLFEDKAISGQEMDQMENQWQVAGLEYARSESAAARAKANLDDAKVAVGYARITAPTNGIVSKKNIDVGSMAEPGMPLMVVEDVSAFEVDAYVDERLVDKVKLDATADIVIDSIGARLKGTIAAIVHAIDPMSRTYLVKISIPTDANEYKLLKTGLYAKVLIPHGRKTVLLVPAKAVVDKGQLIGVYAVDEQNVVTYRLIRTGKRYDDSVEVLSGLGDEQRIVVKGVQNAVDGGILGDSSAEN